jgi:hypothetical protein
MAGALDRTSDRTLASAAAKFLGTSASVQDDSYACSVHGTSPGECAVKPRDVQKNFAVYIMVAALPIEATPGCYASHVDPVLNARGD